MKKEKVAPVEQPAPFTPGITKGMVRQHAYEMFRDKLPEHPLTLEDWVLRRKTSRTRWTPRTGRPRKPPGLAPPSRIVAPSGIPGASSPAPKRSSSKTGNPNLGSGQHRFPPF